MELGSGVGGDLGKGEYLGPVVGEDQGDRSYQRTVKGGELWQGREGYQEGGPNWGGGHQLGFG